MDFEALDLEVDKPRMNDELGVMMAGPYKNPMG